MTDYSVWLLNGSNGTPIKLVDEFISLDYTRITNGVGAFTITLPEAFDLSLVSQDSRIVVFRKPNNGARYLDFCGFVRYIEQADYANGFNATIAGYDLNDLLRRRIIAYAAGTAYATKSDKADDMAKAIVRENLGASATVAARNLTAYGFTVQADTGAATAIEKGFSWRNVLDVLQEIANSSHTVEATSLYFGIVALNNGWECEFQTNVQQWGADRRFPNGTSPVIIAVEFNNLIEAIRSINYRDEINYGYGGGQGEGTARTIQEASDAVRIAASPFNRCEQFVDARNETAAAAVLDMADQAVRNGRPRNSFRGKLIDTPQVVYGREYNFGDYVTAMYRGQQIDCRIESVRVVVSDKEQVEITLRRES